MNIKLWNEAVDWIEEHPEEYDQREPGLTLPDSLQRHYHCSAPCCFFGVVGMLTDLMCDSSNDLRMMVRELLGLTPVEAAALFGEQWPRDWFRRIGADPAPNDYGMATIRPTPQEAITILRRMAEEGGVWV